jgi:hypothetical protein
MQGNKRQRGEMRTRQEAEQTMARWQQPARDAHLKKKKKKKDSNSRWIGFWIRILGINAILLGYFKNCKLKTPVIKR